MNPHLILYCQHSLGMGHLVRSLALADALTQYFDVTFLNGGRWPQGFRRPGHVSVIDLAPIGMAEDGSLTSLTPNMTLEASQADRLFVIKQLLDLRPPQALLIELYPFGRKKFRFEIDPLIDAARQGGAIITCSVRDILVASRHDQQRHDNRAAATLNEKFDCVIIHSDEKFARLEESFKPTAPLSIPIEYSGFVAPRSNEAPRQRTNRLVVSTGGGIVGGPLYRTALAAYPDIRTATDLPMEIITGPFLPDDEWKDLCKKAADMDGVTLIRSTPNLYARMCAATHSISQCGYNSALDILRSGVSGIVVPFVREGEDEQLARASRLAKLGALTLIHPDKLSADALAMAVKTLAANKTSHAKPHGLRINGAVETAAIVNRYLNARARKQTLHVGGAG